MTGPRRRNGWAPRRLRLLLISVASLTLAVGCTDGGDDLSPLEPEVGEDDTEIVPGEGGPVD